MNWKRLLAYITGSVDQELLLRNEYLVAETYYVLTFMRVASRKVCIAGITTSPDRQWTEQMARNVTLAEIGFLCGCQYLLHDRDAKFCACFDGVLESVGVKAVLLPPRSPNLNAPSGEVEPLGERGVPVENDLVRRGLTLASAVELRFSLSHGTQPSREG